MALTFCGIRLRGHSLNSHFILPMDSSSTVILYHLQHGYVYQVKYVIVNTTESILSVSDKPFYTKKDSTERGDDWSVAELNITVVSMRHLSCLCHTFIYLLSCYQRNISPFPPRTFIYSCICWGPLLTVVFSEDLYLLSHLPMTITYCRLLRWHILTVVPFDDLYLLSYLPMIFINCRIIQGPLLTFVSYNDLYFLSYHTRTFTYCRILRWLLITVVASDDLSFLSYPTRTFANCRIIQWPLFTVVSSENFYLQSHHTRTLT